MTHPSTQSGVARRPTAVKIAVILVAVVVALGAAALVTKIVLNVTPGDATDAPASTPAATTKPQPSHPPASTPPADAEEDVPGIGDSATTEAGVTLRVDAMTCGLSSAGEGAPAPLGEYCVVTFTVNNVGDGAIDVLATDLHGHVSSSTFEAVPGIGRLGDDMATATVLPGMTIEGILFFDVPAGSALDTLSITGEWFDGAVDVRAPTDSE